MEAALERALTAHFNAFKFMNVLKTSLLEHNKAERRRRILAAARKIIGKHGYDGLTMRDLAVASRVSVPTLYNLFGGKVAILAEEMQETFASIARTPMSSLHADFVDRVFAVYDAGFHEMLGKPGYYREVVRVFLTERETDALRRSVELRYIEAMADNLRAAQTTGELADWVDAELLSAQLFFHYMMSFLGWAKGDLDDDRVRSVAHYGLCMLLLGVVRGDSVRRLEKRLRDLQKTLR